MIKKRKRFNKVCIFFMLCVVLCSVFLIPSAAAESIVDVDYNMFSGWNFLQQIDWSSASVPDEGQPGVTSYNDDTGYVSIRLYRGATAGYADLGLTLRELMPYVESGATYVYRATLLLEAGGFTFGTQGEVVLTDAILDAPLRYSLPSGTAGEAVEFTGYATLFYKDDDVNQRYYPTGTKPFSETEAFVARVDALFNSTIDDAYNTGYESGKNDAIESFRDRTFLLTSENLNILTYALNKSTGNYEMISYPTPLNMQSNWIKFADLGANLTDPANLTFNEYSFIRFNAEVYDEPFYWAGHDLFVKNDDGRTAIIIEDMDGLQLFYGNLPATEGEYVNALDVLNQSASNELYDKQIGRIALLFYGDAESDYKPDANGGFYFINKDDPYYDDVYAAGEQKGKEEGFEAGKEQGRIEGRDELRDEYENDVIPTIRREEYSAGYARGDEQGYWRGLADGQNGENILYAVITAPVDAAVNMVRSFLNFEVLGVNVAGLLAGVLTVCVALAVLKYII